METFDRRTVMYASLNKEGDDFFDVLNYFGKMEKSKVKWNVAERNISIAENRVDSILMERILGLVPRILESPSTYYEPNSLVMGDYVVQNREAVNGYTSMKTALDYLSGEDDTEGKLPVSESIEAPTVTAETPSDTAKLPVVEPNVSLTAEETVSDTAKLPVSDPNVTLAVEETASDTAKLPVSEPNVTLAVEETASDTAKLPVSEPNVTLAVEETASDTAKLPVSDPNVSLTVEETSSDTVTLPMVEESDTASEDNSDTVLSNQYAVEASNDAETSPVFELVEASEEEVTEAVATNANPSSSEEEAPAEAVPEKTTKQQIEEAKEVLSDVQKKERALERVKFLKDLFFENITLPDMSELTNNALKDFTISIYNRCMELGIKNHTFSTCLIFAGSEKSVKDIYMATGRALGLNQAKVFIEAKSYYTRWVKANYPDFYQQYPETNLLDFFNVFREGNKMF